MDKELLQQSNQLATAQKMMVPTNYSVASKKISGLTDEENIILNKKYISKQICRMNTTEVMFAAKNLLIKIHVITGWVLPVSEVLNILIDVFSKKLVEDYSGLNIDEIEHAFVKSGTTIEDWGKEMNLNLLDKILAPYLEKRFELSKTEEKQAGQPEQKIYTDEEILNQRRSEIETAFQAMRKGRYPLLHVYFLEILQEDELLKPEETVAAFFSRKLRTAKNIYERSR